jgi:hypothetical protein
LGAQRGVIYLSQYALLELYIGAVRWPISYISKVVQQLAERCQDDRLFMFSLQYGWLGLRLRLNIVLAPVLR